MQRTAPVFCAAAIAALALLVPGSGELASAAPTYSGWVTNLGDGTVTVFSLDDYSVLATHKVGKKPRGIHPIPGENVVVVANSASKTVSVVATTAGEIEVHPVGRKPYDVVVLSPADAALATLAAENALRTVTEDDDGGRYPVSKKPWGIDLSPDGEIVAVACSKSGSVDLIPATDAAIRRHARTVVDIGTKPTNVAFDHRGKQLAVVDTAGQTLTIVNPKTGAVLEQMDVGDGIWDGAFHPKNNSTGAVSLRSTNEVLLFEGDNDYRIAVGRKPMGLVFTPDGKHILVANSGSRSVSVINVKQRAVVATIPVGKKPYAVAVTEDD